MPKKLKPVAGATVVVKRDMITRGQRWFRAGLKMRISSTDGGIGTYVYVRGVRHYLLSTKKEFDQNFEVVSAPDTPTEEDESNDD